jgi:hypothetical protein
MGDPAQSGAPTLRRGTMWWLGCDDGTGLRYTVRSPS